MNNSITKNKTTFTTQNLVLMALFAAVLCVSAYISIPLPNGSHITALNFVVTLIGLVFAVEQSFFISLVWLYSVLSVYLYLSAVRVESDTCSVSTADILSLS